MSKIAYFICQCDTSLMVQFDVLDYIGDYSTWMELKVNWK